MIKEYNVIRDWKRVPLCLTKNGNTKIVTYLEAITEEQEKFLDKYVKKDIFTGFTTCANTKIPANLIFGYGDININSKKDIAFIRSLDIVPDRGFYARTSFDYEKGTIHTTGERPNVVLMYTCWDRLKYFKEKHCEIGKAPKVIIYKEIKFRKHH